MTFVYKLRSRYVSIWWGNNFKTWNIRILFPRLPVPVRLISIGPMDFRWDSYEYDYNPLSIRLFRILRKCKNSDGCNYIGHILFFYHHITICLTVFVFDLTKNNPVHKFYCHWLIDYSCCETDRFFIRSFSLYKFMT